MNGTFDVAPMEGSGAHRFPDGPYKWHDGSAFRLLARTGGNVYSLARMDSDSGSNLFKIGDLVRKIGDEQVGEVVSVGDDGLFVRYKNDSSSVTFYPVTLVERVKAMES